MIYCMVKMAMIVRMNTKSFFFMAFFVRLMSALFGGEVKKIIFFFLLSGRKNGWLDLSGVSCRVSSGLHTYSYLPLLSGNL